MADEYRYASAIDVGPCPEPGRSLVVDLPNPPSGHERDQAFFYALDDGTVVGYFNRCGHIGVPMDFDDGEFLDTNGFVMCRIHGARYDLRTGEPVLGPSMRPLVRVEVELKDGRLFAHGWRRGNG